MTSKTLAEIASLVGATLSGDSSRCVSGAEALLDAGSDDISFLGDPRYVPQLELTRAAAVLVSEDHPVTDSSDGPALLRVANPSGAMTLVAECLASKPETPSIGVHPSAVVDSSAQVASGVSIGALCVVGPRAVIGEGTVLHPAVVLGEGAEVGAGSVLHPRVVLYPFVKIGRDCVLEAGVVLGSRGFGYEPTADGWIPVPQSGRVELGDRVDIGANCAVDCARIGATRFGNGVKLDNLVHVAHNVKIDDNSMVLGQVGLAGSAHLGKWVIIAGQVGINGHRTLGDGVKVGGGSRVFDDIPPGKEVFGVPAHDKKTAIRNLRVAPRLHEMRRHIRDLEARLAQLERGTE